VDDTGISSRDGQEGEAACAVSSPDCRWREESVTYVDVGQRVKDVDNRRLEEFQCL
jgi:hypothetical protein